VLEPSAGSGAFVEGMSRHELRASIAHVVAIEPHPLRAAACRDALAREELSNSVLEASALDASIPPVDVVIGNPPFVRFQHVDAAEAAGTTNLWTRVLRAALDALRPYGVFVLLLPGELLSGVSAGPVRHWLLRHFDDLEVELVAPAAFRGVQSEIVMLSGRRRASERDATVITVLDSGVQFEHRLRASEATWTRWLLPPEALSAMNSITASASVTQLGDVARFELGATTGANDWFCIDDHTRVSHVLTPWARPHLARTRDARGLRFTEDDHQVLASRGKPAWLLDFGAEPDPMNTPDARAYIDQGAATGVAQRHKCRIRSRWYRLPNPVAAPLMLPKRAHRHPVLIENLAGAVTTDTIYRGWPTDAALSPADLIVAFGSTVTQLSAELEGRVLGGGALELVPSAIARLAVIRAPGIGTTLPALDAIVRRRHPLDVDDAIVDGADRLLASRVGLDVEELFTLRHARDRLLTRRLGRPGG